MATYVRGRGRGRSQGRQHTPAVTLPSPKAVYEPSGPARDLPSVLETTPQVTDTEEASDDVVRTVRRRRRCVCIVQWYRQTQPARDADAVW